MKRSLLASVTALALLAGAVSVQGGENDLGLKASGNADGPSGAFKGRAETSGQSFGATLEADSKASANPNSNNHDTGRVETPEDVTVKPPRSAPAPSLR
jgi:hypothetical protein